MGKESASENDVQQPRATANCSDCANKVVPVGAERHAVRRILPWLRPAQNGSAPPMPLATRHDVGLDAQPHSWQTACLSARRLTEPRRGSSASRAHRRDRRRARRLHFDSGRMRLTLYGLN